MKLFIVLFSILLISCGKSPIFDHEHEDDQKIVSTVQTLESDMLLEQTGIKISRLWLAGPFPSSDQESNLLLIFTDKNGNLTDLPDGYEIVPEGWMDSMGHGTADDGYLENIGKGKYLHKDLFFNMAGDWTYTLYLYKGDEFIEQTSYQFEF